MRQSTGFTARFVAPVLIGPILNPINTTMISVALVPIAADLKIGTSTVIWLVAGLYLTSAIAQPVMGTLADRLGPRRVYLTGLVVVLIAGVLPSVVQGFGGALTARILIGLGTSAAYPSAMTLLRDQSARAGIPTPPALLSGLSISSLATSSVGPVLGGILIFLFGWRSIFLVNVPLALIALVMALLWLPLDSTRPVATRKVGLLQSIDPVGILLFAAGIASLLFFLLDLDSGYWVLLGAGVVLVVGFVFWERRRPSPFIDVRMLASNGPLTRTYARQFLVYLSAYSMVYGFSQWLQDSAGFSTSVAGFVQLPTAILAGAASIAVARRTALRLPLIVAGVAPLLGGLMLVVLHSTSPLWALLVLAGLFGLGQGLTSVSNQAALYRQAPGDRIGSASGLSRTAIYLGAIVSSSLIGLIFGDRPSDGGLHVIGWVIVGATAVATLLAIFDRSLRQRTLD